MRPTEERRNATEDILSVRETHFRSLRSCGDPNHVPDGPSVIGGHLLLSEKKPVCRKKDPVEVTGGSPPIRCRTTRQRQGSPLSTVKPKGGTLAVRGVQVLYLWCWVDPGRVSDGPIRDRRSPAGIGKQTGASKIGARRSCRGTFGHQDRGRGPREER